MLQFDHLVLAVSNIYKYRSGKAAAAPTTRTPATWPDTLYATRE